MANKEIPLSPMRKQVSSFGGHGYTSIALTDAM